MSVAKNSLRVTSDIIEADCRPTTRVCAHQALLPFYSDWSTAGKTNADRNFELSVGEGVR